MQGYIEKRGEGHYRLRFDVGYDEAGNRIRKSVTVRGTRKEAQARLRELLKEFEQKTRAPTAKMTVAEYLDYWLEHYAAQLAKRTAENYAEYVRYYIKPHIGSVPLDKLTRHQIQSFYAELEKNGRRKVPAADSARQAAKPNPWGAGLSPTTVFNIHRVFKGALKQAVIWEFVSKNPADGVKPPQPDEREHRILSVEELALVLSAAAETQIFLPVLLGWSVGLRRGEICGLRWQDVDLKNGIAAIRHTLVRVSTGNLIFKPPKTKSGRRSVKLAALLVEALTREGEKLRECRRVLGSSYNPHNLVVCRANGSPVNPTTIYQQFQTLLERLELPRIAIHDLRHTHATHLLQQGINVKVVAERLGHADPGITLRVYAHVLQSMQAEAADRTNDLLEQAINGTEPDEIE